MRDGGVMPPNKSLTLSVMIAVVLLPLLLWTSMLICGKLQST